MITYNISLTKELAKVVEKAMKEYKFGNRSEFFRDLVRKYYVRKNNLLIEEIDPSDPDYKYVDLKPNKSNYTSIEKVAEELNVKL